MLSNDITVLEDLIETLEDGRQGFTQAAEKLEDDGHPEIAAQMMGFSNQRAQFSNELRQLASSTGTEIEESGSVAGALHRGWMSLKDALTGDDPHAILSAAETGEDHAVSEYEDALADEALPSEFRDVVRKQAAEVRRAHDTVRALRDQFAD